MINLSWGGSSRLVKDWSPAMGGALIRAYGVLMRRARALPRLDMDLDGDR